MMPTSPAQWAVRWAARDEVDARAIPALRALAGSLTGDQSIPTRVALSEAARVLDLADVAEGRERS